MFLRIAINRNLTDKIFGSLFLLLAKLNIFVVCKSVYGIKLINHYADATFRFCINGSYGRLYSNYLKNIDFSFIFIDVGANQGLYSLVAANNVNCSKCYAFEPVKETYKRLVANSVLNRLSAKLETFNYAVSSNSGIGFINFNHNHSGTASLHHKIYNSVSEQVNCINVGELNKILNFNSTLPLVVKIDVEGGEVDVIAQLLSINGSGSIVSFFVEIDESWIDAEFVFYQMKIANFKEVFRTSGTGHYDVLFTRDFNATY